jgi:hypothetical protein
MGDETGARRLFFPDPRSDRRHMRVTWHPETSTIVFSHWVGAICIASNAVPTEEVGPLVALLTDALRDMHPPLGAPHSDSA